MHIISGFSQFHIFRFSWVPFIYIFDCIFIFNIYSATNSTHL